MVQLPVNNAYIFMYFIICYLLTLSKHAKRVIVVCLSSVCLSRSDFGEY